MNVYDFDNTIYKGDSSVDFYFYSLRKKPSIICDFPFITAIKFVFGKEEKQVWKEKFFSFVSNFDNIDKHINDFWDKKIKNIKDFYYEIQREDDVIISASPEFLIRPICERLNIKYVMASPVDKYTGKYHGKNCWGEEKVIRFREFFPDEKIENFYSDSYSDTPLARLADKAYLVKGETLLPWEKWDSDLGKL